MVPSAAEVEALLRLQYTSDRMATCPKCGGHLTTSHRCPRSRFHNTFDLALAGLVGGITALVMAAIFDRNQVVTAYDGYFLAGGIAIGMLTQSLLRAID
jgi:hypothetical protein